MIAMMSYMIFAGALGTSMAVIAAMVLPQWRRIASLAMGNREMAFAPLATLAVAERRIAARRRAAQSSVSLSVSRMREAA